MFGSAVFFLDKDTSLSPSMLTSFRVDLFTSAVLRALNLLHVWKMKAVMMMMMIIIIVVIIIILRFVFHPCFAQYSVA